MHYESGVQYVGELILENGKVRQCHIAYEIVGQWPIVNDRVIIICHALTGNQYAYGNKMAGWWRPFIGPGQMIDTNEFTVITTNIVGGCNGTSIEQEHRGYPDVTIRDMVRAQQRFLQTLNIETVHAIIGGSLGGMQVWEWSIMDPSFARVYIPLAATPVFSDYAIAYNHIAEQAILAQLSPSSDHVPDEVMGRRSGLEIARMIGMITYRSPQLFNERFKREKATDGRYQIQSYLDYQGEKLLKRFNVNSYLTLLRAMNNHDVSRGRSSLEEAFNHIERPVIAIGFENDLLYPSETIKDSINLLQSLNKTAVFYEVDTLFGHDGFLVEADKWGFLVSQHIMQYT